MRWPTTLVVLSVIFSVTALGWKHVIDGAAVTSIYGSIVSAVLLGHYVKTINGSVGRGNVTPPSDPAKEEQL